MRVRFAEPMVPVAELGALAAASTVRPAITTAAGAPIAGAWRWLDTRVLAFGGRIPNATEVVVTVAAGARAAGGATLAHAATARFTTPPVQIAHAYPRGPVRPDSPLALALDQAVDPAALARFLRVEVHGDSRARALAFRVVDVAEAARLWRAHPGLRFDASRAAEALGEHHVIVAPTGAWPAGARLRVALLPGAPAREGPRVTTRERDADFHVAPAFRIEGVACNGREPRRAGVTCPADGYVEVALTNAIAPASFRAAGVRITGGGELASEPLDGGRIALLAPGRAGARVEVGVPAGLTDVYGQPLTGAAAAAFTTIPARVEPSLWAPAGLLVLDPRFAIPQWAVGAEAVPALRVELYRVTPDDYFAYRAWERGERRAPPGVRVSDTTHAVGTGHDAELHVDLRPALDPAGHGHVLAIASTPGRKLDRRIAWIQVTKLAVSARFDRERVHAWVQDLTPARMFRPVAGVDTALIADGRADAPAAVASDAEGRVAYDLLPATGAPRGRRWHEAILVARAAADSTFAVLGGDPERAIRAQRARWYVTDDRFTYKPGEPVYVKGWVRWTHDGPNPDLALPAAGEPLAYALHDERGAKLAAGSATLTAHGGFDLEIALPRDANLGTAMLELSTRSSTHRHPIAIQEFRTPAFAVDLDDDVTHAGAAPVYLGERVEMRAAARYYAGGGLAGAAIAWRATLTAASFRPPGLDAYGFDPPRAPYAAPAEAETSGALSGASDAAIAWGVAALPRGRPSVLAVDATVTDLDRATIRASSRPILVHPSRYYVGLRGRPGELAALDVVVADVDGRLVPGVAVEVTIEGKLRDDTPADTHACKLTSAAAPVACRWTVGDPRVAYTATATVADPRGRRNATRYEVPRYTSADDGDELAILPDRPSYRPGDVARLELRSKVVPATAIVTFARRGVIAQRRVELTAPSTIVELPIEPAFVQNVHVVVDRYAPRPSRHAYSALPLPDHDQRRVALAVDLDSARLAMTARPLRPLVEPGAEATFEVEVRRDGRPEEGAEVALVVVDEAVLALADRGHADPLAPFYAEVGHDTRATSSVELVRDGGAALAATPGLSRGRIGLRGRSVAAPSVQTGQGYGMGSGHGGLRGRSVVTSRKDFRATAAFAPRLRTDADGRARLTVTMPDSLTRFRVVALAAAGAYHFGKAESTIVTQRALNARTVAPRFLTQGDAFALPVIVQNLGRAPRTIDVAVRAANLTAAGPAGKRVTVPAGGRAEVRFELATRARGRAIVQTIAAAGGFADASTVELPVYEPATTEAFATYGIVDDAPRFEQLAVPADVFPEVGGVEIELASTQLQALTDAYWYLYAYPHECAEQRSGRMLATAAMHDLLEAFRAPGRPARADIEARRTTDAAQLAKTQNADGGWGYFGGMGSDPFVTMQVLAALAAERATGEAPRRAAAFVAGVASARLARLAQEAALPLARRRDRDHGYQVELAATALGARRDRRRRARAPRGSTRSRPARRVPARRARARARAARRPRPRRRGPRRARGRARRRRRGDRGPRHRDGPRRSGGAHPAAVERAHHGARARRADARGARPRARPQARARRARRAPARPVALDAGEPGRAAGAAPLLRHLRARHARLHRQAVARPRRLRRAGVPRPRRHARPRDARLVRPAPGLHARPRARQGRPRSHVLPCGHHLRAEAHGSARARSRVRRAPQLHRDRRSGGRRAHAGRLAGAPGRARARDARGADHGAALERGAGRPAARRVRGDQRGARDGGARGAGRRRRRRRPLAVGPPQPAGQPRRGVRRRAARRRPPVLLHRTRRDARHVPRRARQGRGDVRSGDVRALDGRDRRDRERRKEVDPSRAPG